MMNESVLYLSGAMLKGDMAQLCQWCGDMLFSRRNTLEIEKIM